MQNENQNQPQGGVGCFLPLVLMAIFVIVFCASPLLAISVALLIFVINAK